MSNVTTAMVKELRELTGAGPMDCKRTLEQTDGDMQKAAVLLREKGLAKAAKKLDAGRAMNEGRIETYLHFNRRLGVIVEINCETDFVAKTEAFQSFCRDIAIHIASLNPQYVSREDIPQTILDQEREKHFRRALEDGKPETIAQKVADGRMAKFYGEAVLMEQVYVKDEEKTITQLLQERVAELGESIKINRFARFALGETKANDAETQS